MTTKQLLKRIRDAIVMPLEDVPRDWLISDLDRADGLRDPLEGEVHDRAHDHLRQVIHGFPLD